MFPRPLIQPPFWSRIPVLGVRTYPASFSGRIVFWISAIVYSIVYFYLIALAVVIFTHALWTWSSFQSYITTTLFDIVQKNIWLVAAFVIAESIMIYRAAKKNSSDRRPYRLTPRTFLSPLFFLAVTYGILKLFSKSYELEPNFVPVVVSSYVVLLIAMFLIDKYIPKT